MNARLLPVIVVTAVFMLAWSGDRNAMQAALARRDAVQSVLLAQTYGQKTLEPNEARHVSTLVSRSETASAVEDSELVPLPEGIASGVYQAVNQSGASVRVSVPSQGKTDQTNSRDFYISDSKAGERWYIVRIQSPMTVH